MRVVEKAMLYPQHCAVTGWEDGPYVDLGITIPPGRDYRLYLRFSAVEEAAKKIGMVPAAELEKVRAERDEAASRILELEERIAAQDRMIAAVTLPVPDEPDEEPINKKKVAA